jgi:hypothetical protein
MNPRFFWVRLGGRSKETEMTEESKAKSASGGEEPSRVAPPSQAATSDAGPSPAAPSEEELQRLEGRLARLEAQVRAHSDRLAEWDQGARTKKQQGLMLRLALLVLALGAFFFLKMRAGA